MYLIVFLVLGCVIILGLWQGENESKIIAGILLVFLWLMMAANTDNPDYNNYLTAYNTIHLAKGLEWGYDVLAKFCIFLGLNYNQYRFVLAAIGLLLIHKTVKKYLNNSVIFYTLYFFCPFMMDVTQMRNFVAMSFFIFAIPFLEEDDLKGTIKYIVAVILGSLFHTAALVYVPIVFLKNADRGKMTRQILYIAAALSLIIALNRNLITNIMSIVANAVGSVDARIADYSDVRTRWGFLINWCIQLATYILIEWAIYTYKVGAYTVNGVTKTESGAGLRDAREISLLKLGEIINIYAFLFLPFYVIQSTYSRLMRNIVPLNLIILILAYKKNFTGRMKVTVEGALTFIFLIVYTGVIFYFWIYISWSDVIVKALFTGNWFFNLEWHKWCEASLNLVIH